MYNIMVVDDDDTIRANVAKIIDEVLHMQHTLYQANNGLRAVETVCSVPIDIIFADVKMPVCTGIEMMRLLKNLDYTGQIVIISGFDDYALVREAMKLGARDYLLKPIVKGELTDILHQCLHQLDQQSTDRDMPKWQQSGDAQQKAFFAQQYWVKQLQMNEEHAALEFCNSYGLDQQTPIRLYTIADRLVSSNNENQRFSLYTTIQQLINTTMQGQSFVCIQGATEQYWVILLAVPNKGQDLDDQEFIKCLKKRYIYIATASPLYTIAQLSAAFEECENQQEQFFYDMVGEATPPIPDYPYKKAFTKLVELASHYEFEKFSESLRQLFYAFGVHRPAVNKTKELLGGMLYHLMSENSRYIAIISKYKFTAMDIEQVIQDAAHASMLYKQMIDIMHQYMQDAAEHNPNQEDYAIRRVKQYIEAEYMNNPSLVEISQHLGLHPNYLSTLFSQKVGTTYTRYLRQKRIDRAKDLMSMTNMKLYEIAEMVGYKDNAHFYHAFKAATGMSPAQYKKTIP